MPSESFPTQRARIARALSAIAPQLAAFHSLTITALERARAVLAPSGGAERARRELGVIGNRIDAAKFASIVRGDSGLDATARARVLRAAESLESLAAVSEEAFVIDVPTGAALSVVVREALGHFGRAFGLAATIDLVRSGRYVPELHDRAADVWPFELWTQRERRVAPPLVVTVDGADLNVGDLANVLDGASHIVLVVSGETAPARLVRLVSPGTLVLQTTTDRGLERFSAYSGPAVAAVMEGDVATFLHDPEGGKCLWQRLAVLSRPDAAPRKRIGALSPAQQVDELHQLEALAERPVLSTAPIDQLVPGGPGDPADRLAAWLLAESDASAA
jgi:hypothetical protein